ncbi:efflux RND transporter permease subunit [Myxococcota bacterium]|nr:efflux RND transporter permease subunit [Myxococcota bacterium]MBU1897960.1 efflux RND transporter permease subunit [Myxococcota bacterium]
MSVQMKGPVGWMAQNPVAANLLMVALMAGGAILAMTQIKQEVFPEFTLDMVSISVPYPGASPDEVERGIVELIEENVRGLDGIKRVTSSAVEGVGAVSIELLDGVNKDRVLSDIKAAVDRIVNFPEDAEEPTVSLVQLRRQVIQLALYGDLEEETLRQVAEDVREELLNLPEITQLELAGIRPREIAVELNQDKLRQFDLTMNGVAAAIRRSSLDLPAGLLKTQSGHILLRTTERRDYASEFKEVSLKSLPDGTVLKLGDVAVVKDGFEENDVTARYNGKPAILFNINRVGDQTPLEVAGAVNRYAEASKGRFPGIEMDTFNDRSIIFGERVDLLRRNAISGLILVFITLGFFLEVRLSFWVMMGIPISILGSFWFMPIFDVSINMISLFAFIITLGIVVDDAIVVGENIFEKRMNGVPPLKAAVEGAVEVSVPVIFSVLTTLVAFSPLFFVPGVSGKFFRNVPTVVIAVLSISLIESLLILPAHLNHMKSPGKERGFFALTALLQAKAGRFVDWLIYQTYQPILRRAVRNRYTIFAAASALLIGTVGFVRGGHIDFTFMPKIEGDVVRVSATLPVGAPVEESRAVEAALLESIHEILARNGGEAIAEGIFTLVGASADSGGARSTGGGASGSNLVDITLQLVPSDQRSVTGEEIARQWRLAASNLVGLDNLKVSAALRMGGGMPVDVELQHRDVEVLQAAALELVEIISQFEGATEVDDGFDKGKPQIDMRLTPLGRALGLTETDLARQVRDTYFGAEALRQQRGRDEVRVMVRFPEADRATLASFERLTLRTPSGGEVPITEAAELSYGHAYNQIKRVDGRRVINVTSDVDNAVSNGGKIVAQLQEGPLQRLMAHHAGLSYNLEGEMRDRKDTFKSLGLGFLMAMLIIYALLAVPFRSYIQPIIIMSAIPFGFIGAIFGHVLLDYDLSLMSMMGIVALAGIVVNDSLILIMAINERRSSMTLFEAVISGGVRRFRPIILTSLTTFFGLLPMIFESSVQARFLIPMALSLGFGVLFATFIILLLIPSLYMIVEDTRALLGWRDPAARPAPLEGEAPA